jgi:hypothetical protein
LKPEQIRDFRKYNTKVNSLFPEINVFVQIPFSALKMAEKGIVFI